LIAEILYPKGYLSLKKILKRMFPSITKFQKKQCMK